MVEADWDERQVRSFACQIEVAEAGDSPVLRWLLMFNPSDQAMPFALPPGHWIGVLDSSAAIAMRQKNWASAQSFSADISISPRSIVGLVQQLPFTA